MAGDPLPVLEIVHLGAELGGPADVCSVPAAAQGLSEMLRNVADPLITDCWQGRSLVAGGLEFGARIGHVGEKHRNGTGASGRQRRVDPRAAVVAATARWVIAFHHTHAICGVPLEFASVVVDGAGLLRDAEAHAGVLERGPEVRIVVTDRIR